MGHECDFFRYSTLIHVGHGLKGSVLTLRATKKGATGLCVCYLVTRRLLFEMSAVCRSRLCLSHTQNDIENGGPAHAAFVHMKSQAALCCDLNRRNGQTAKSMVR